MLQESAPSQSLQRRATERYPFHFKQYLARGRDIFKDNAMLLLVYFAIAVLLTTGAFSILFIIPTKLGLALTISAALLLLPPVWAGFFTGIFASLRGKHVALTDFFRGFTYFPHLAIANLIAALLIFIGSFISLILIPGLYLVVAYLFAAPLIVDRRLKFWQALETSRLIVNQQWLRASGFVLALLLLNLLGALFFGAGLFLTLPFSYCAIAAAYDDIIGLR